MKYRTKTSIEKIQSGIQMHVYLIKVVYTISLISRYNFWYTNIQTKNLSHHWHMHHRWRLYEKCKSKMSSLQHIIYTFYWPINISNRRKDYIPSKSLNYRLTSLHIHIVDQTSIVSEKQTAVWHFICNQNAC